MHAASVNPEPGSNSLKNYILSDAVSRSVNTFSRVYLAFVFTFLSILFFQSVINEIFRTFQCSKFHVVQFSMSKRAAAFRKALVYYIS